MQNESSPPSPKIEWNEDTVTKQGGINSYA